jgi:anti-sigma regulatory factor (Ser/Thr protein kinase)
VRAEVCDRGREFDPLGTPPADVASDLDQRRIGGLGIHLVRTLTDHLAYDRRDGTNRLTFRKALSKEGS